MNESTNVPIDLWQRAASFAARSHQGQLRKDGKTPYVAHPFRVAMTVRQLFNVDDTAVLCAALLHDVIEDTPADYDDLQAEFGAEVADMVACLTKDMRLPEPEREVEYDRRLAAATWKTRLIKLADVYDNLCDLTAANKSPDKAVEKARRAIALAGDDPRLAAAAAAVKALIERTASGTC
ncbi:MAG: HD domain-containing protein [Planctomycetaceae bacterium]